MPRVHDPKCPMATHWHNWGSCRCVCICPPTIQHDPETQGERADYFEPDAIVFPKNVVAILLQEAKEEGRREEQHKIYGGIDPLESRKIENQIVIEQARLEVLEKIEEYIEHHYDRKYGNIHYDGLKQFINALKTNSK